VGRQPLKPRKIGESIYGDFPGIDIRFEGLEMGSYGEFFHRDLMKLIRMCGDFYHGSTGISRGIVARHFTTPKGDPSSSGHGFKGWNFRLRGHIPG